MSTYQLRALLNENLHCGSELGLGLRELGSLWSNDAGDAFVVAHRVHPCAEAACSAALGANV
jgi:hypothetical protein